MGARFMELDTMRSDTSPARRNPLKRQSARTPAARRAGRPVILVVEDNPHDWEIYGKILWYNGFDCMYAADGAAGLRLAAEHRPDLVVLDLGLPGLSGVEVCRRLKADPITADVPVIVLTAQSAQDYAARMAEAGCARFMEKPAGPVEVLHAVEEIVGKAPPAGEGRPPRLRQAVNGPVTPGAAHDTAE
jgi:DNA-binding response OmpR family regulator